MPFSLISVKTGFASIL